MKKKNREKYTLENYYPYLVPRKWFALFQSRSKGLFPTLRVEIFASRNFREYRKIREKKATRKIVKLVIRERKHVM